MKPKPLSALNHLTLPCASAAVSLEEALRRPHRATAASPADPPRPKRMSVPALSPAGVFTLRRNIDDGVDASTSLSAYAVGAFRIGNVGAAGLAAAGEIRLRHPEPSLDRGGHGLPGRGQLEAELRFGLLPRRHHPAGREPDRRPGAHLAAGRFQH